jgi:arylsulfatase A-like enzyme
LHFRQVLAGLTALGADDNTIVFFSSDNGPWLIQQLSGGSAGLLRDGKTTTWEVRAFFVPAIVGQYRVGQHSAEWALLATKVLVVVWCCCWLMML